MFRTNLIKEKLIWFIEMAVVKAQRKGSLPEFELPEIVLEHPQNASHGDYACNLPLRIARLAKANPLEIAEKISELIPLIEGLEKVEVAPPGFINLTLSDEWLAQQTETILRAGISYGNLDIAKGPRVQLEFVSVNPTGPLHVGHGRGAVMGSTIANVLMSAGYAVEKEYYVNDAGAQMEAFYRSLYARYRQAMGFADEVPSDGYHGDYMVDLAKEVIEEKGNTFLDMPQEQALAEIGQVGLEKVLDLLRKDLEQLGVDFDIWFREKSLYESESYEKSMSILQEGGHVIEKEGAVWFASSEMGEDKDNVLVRSNGTPTYFASDVAYHYNKFVERGFDRVIDIWGADHQGHVPRMKAVIRALNIDPDRLEFIITQMVTLKRGDAEIKISKRSGDIITLREVMEEVGTDACRFFFLSRAAVSQMDFDLELAKKQSAENPVYYVQYAHARIASILRLAQEKGIDYSQGDVSLLTTEPELTLLRKMIQLPELVEMVAMSLEPHHLPYYAQDLATLFHSFYKQCRVISDDEALTPARLKLVEAAKIVLARSLHLMGINAPEQM